MKQKISMEQSNTIIKSKKNCQHHGRKIKTMKALPMLQFTKHNTIAVIKKTSLNFLKLQIYLAQLYITILTEELFTL